MGYVTQTLKIFSNMLVCDLICRGVVTFRIRLARAPILFLLAAGRLQQAKKVLETWEPTL